MPPRSLAVDRAAAAAAARGRRARRCDDAGYADAAVRPRAHVRHPRRRRRRCRSRRRATRSAPTCRCLGTTCRRRRELGERLPEWTEDSFAGILLNVAAGRVANRLDLGGTNYTVDAACASSLAAVAAGRRASSRPARATWSSSAASTRSRTRSPTCASARRRRSRRAAAAGPFDAEADGIAISEGVGDRRAEAAGRRRARRRPHLRRDQGRRRAPATAAPRA